MSDLKLKPCPFCGGEAFLNVIPPHKHHFVNLPDYEGGATVECTGCAVGMMMRTVEEVVEAWNRRAQDEPKT